MKQIMMIMSTCLAFTLSGCISMPNASSPSPRFYMLETVSADQVQKINISSNVIIGIKPVKIPEYLDRPQMVTRKDGKNFKFAEFDRWGEYLDVGVAQLIREDLAVMLPSAKVVLYPLDLGATVKYQVNVEIIQLDSELDKDMSLVMQWTIADTKSGKSMIIKRSEFKEPIVPQDYSGLAKTLSTVCASLSQEIAQALANFEIEPRMKKVV